ncbi:hypothetical protein BEWA_014860 [Theileria equi strain WA]|uniref:Lipoyl-binding domain-containing protein n=1 Tax=Theileria equi strain WA TaxID=1537102 RepID=L1LBV6_THEEQ|nr:hypothetical protein BEWA_014860 [Theileria equi strain WA]EKX72927.1 hypothetical protein BEWA_014860 [Theileria equi strain WA]|eukprot:XP_004832379.1 hypothetical protein BEWA_014860 [Theileria equi strain WA]
MYFSSLSKLASIFQNSFTNTSRHLRSKLHHSSNLKISGLDNNKWTRCFSIKSQDESVCPVELSESIVRITPSLESADVSIIKVPQIGKNLKKFKLHQWFKKPGDYVKSGEILCIIETEKIFGKVYSQLSGIVIENVCKEV